LEGLSGACSSEYDSLILFTEIFLASFGSLIFIIPGSFKVIFLLHLTGTPITALCWVVISVKFTSVRFIVMFIIVIFVIFVGVILTGVILTG